MPFRGPMNRSFATIMNSGKTIATVSYNHHADHFDVLLFVNNMTSMLREYGGDTIRTNGASYTEESLRAMLTRSKKIVPFYSPYIPLMTTTADDDRRAMEMDNSVIAAATAIASSIDFGSGVDACSCAAPCDF